MVDWEKWSHHKWKMRIPGDCCQFVNFEWNLNRCYLAAPDISMIQAFYLIHAHFLCVISFTRPRIISSSTGFHHKLRAEYIFSTVLNDSIRVGFLWASKKRLNKKNYIRWLVQFHASTEHKLLFNQNTRHPVLGAHKWIWKIVNWGSELGFFHSIAALHNRLGGKDFIEHMNDSANS